MSETKHDELDALAMFAKALMSMSLHSRYATLRWLNDRFPERPGVSCHCPKKWGQDCPLTVEGCDERFASQAWKTPAASLQGEGETTS